MGFSKKKARYVAAAMLVIVLVASFAVNWRRKQRLVDEQIKCVGTLYAIHSAKVFKAQQLRLAKGDAIANADLVKQLGYPVPSCPSGGKYVIGNVGELPTCTHTNVVWRMQRYLPFVSGSSESALRHEFKGPID